MQQTMTTNGDGNGHHPKWHQWPAKESFDRVQNLLDETVLELDWMHHRLVGEIVPPVTTEEVANLTAFGAWCALDLSILQGKLDDLAEIREEWQRWLVRPRGYYQPAP